MHMAIVKTDKRSWTDFFNTSDNGFAVDYDHPCHRPWRSGTRRCSEPLGTLGEQAVVFQLTVLSTDSCWSEGVGGSSSNCCTTLPMKAQFLRLKKNCMAYVDFWTTLLIREACCTIKYLIRFRGRVGGGGGVKAQEHETGILFFSSFCWTQAANFRDGPPPGSCQLTVSACCTFHKLSRTCFSTS